MRTGRSSYGVMDSSIRWRRVRDFSILRLRILSERSKSFPEYERSRDSSISSCVTDVFSRRESFSRELPIASEIEVLVSSFVLSASLYAARTFHITFSSSCPNRRLQVSADQIVSYFLTSPFFSSQGMSVHFFSSNKRFENIKK